MGRKLCILLQRARERALALDTPVRVQRDNELGNRSCERNIVGLDESISGMPMAQITQWSLRPR